jgi:hypothetical protein
MAETFLRATAAAFLPSWEAIEGKLECDLWQPMGSLRQGDYDAKTERLMSAGSFEEGTPHDSAFSFV